MTHGSFPLLILPLVLHAGVPAIFIPTPEHLLVARSGPIVAILDAGEIRFRSRDDAADVRINFERSRRRLPEGAAALDTRLNFLSGSDSRSWRTNVQGFAKGRYRDVWPGIDIDVHGEHGGFEYDVFVAPGADPARIVFSFHGASVKIENGDIVLSTNLAVLRHKQPLAVQNGRRIPARYIEKANGEIGICLGEYDRSKPLVIDPVITYATYLGGGKSTAIVTGLVAFSDTANAIAVDSAGNAYITGKTEAPDFPVTAGVFHSAKPGAFIAKIDPTGTKLLYATFFGGDNGTSGGQSIAVDSSGAVYVSGFTYTSNFPLTSGALISRVPFSAGGFALKLAPDGSRLIYSTLLFGSGDGIAIDAGGNAYITGRVGRGAGFTATPGAYQSSLSGESDAFVYKINASGTAFVYATLIGGGQFEGGNAITVDGGGNAYIAGTTNSPDFPVTAGAFQRACACPSGDAFVTKLDSAGARILFSTYLGGKGDDTPKGISLDSRGFIYVAGNTNSPDFPVTPEAYQRSPPVLPQGYAPQSGFVTKLDPSGARLEYSTYLFGSMYPQLNGLAVDSDGGVFVTGSVGDPAFPTTPDAFPYYGRDVFYSFQDAFLSHLDPSGQRLVYSSRFGGDSGDGANAIAIGPNRDVYIAGFTQSDDLPVSPGAIQPTLSHGFTNGGFPQDAFVMRIAFGDFSVWPASLKFENLTPHAPSADAVLNTRSMLDTHTFDSNAKSETGWLMAQSAGVTPATVRVTVTPGGLPPGTYNGTVGISGGAAPGQIPVTMIVSNLQTSATTLSFGPDSGAGPQIIRVTGGTGIYFSAASDSAWLRTEYPAGVTPARLNISVDPAGLTSGDYTGTLTFTPGRAQADAVMVTVTLSIP